MTIAASAKEHLDAPDLDIIANAVVRNFCSSLFSFVAYCLTCLQQPRYKRPRDDGESPHLPWPGEAGFIGPVEAPGFVRRRRRSTHASECASSTHANGSTKTHGDTQDTAAAIYSEPVPKMVHAASSAGASKAEAEQLQRLARRAAVTPLRLDAAERHLLQVRAVWLVVHTIRILLVIPASALPA